MKLTATIKFMKEWLIIVGLLVINDYAMRRVVGIPTWYTSVAEWLPYIAIGAAFVLISRPVTLFIKVAIFSCLQLIWFSTYQYFGNALSPELVRLSVSQMYEIEETARGEFYLFVYPLLAVLILNSLFFTILLRIKRNTTRDLTRTGIALALLPFIVVSARAFLHGSPAAMTPTPYLPSHTATVQSVMLAIRSMVSTQSLSDVGAPSVKFNTSNQPVEKNTTVVFIMGESITPSQMEIYGGAPGTMPRMAKRLANPGLLSYSTKVGFSAGVATLGSVPMTLRLAHNPVVAQRNLMTLPQLAKNNGFSVGIYSAQNIAPLQIAGKLTAADKLESLEQWVDEYAVKMDDILIDQMNKSRIEGDKKFYFIHQRINHAPYKCYLDEQASEASRANDADLQANGTPPYSAEDRARIRSYRRGLLCYDKSLDDLIAHFEANAGPLYIFIMADHNELMGEDGRWGHARLELDNAVVPMILVTNRPDSPIARSFRELTVPTSFDMARLTANAVGVDVSLEHPDDQFYVNGVLAFGQAGYFAVRRTEDPSIYKTRLIEALPDKKRSAEQTVTIPLMKKMLDYLEHTKNSNP